MTILAINSSPRKEKGNTAIMLNWAISELTKEGLTVEVENIGGLPVHGCRACYACFKTKNQKCIIDDYLNDLIPRVFAADALILASPVYFADLTPELKAFIDRVGLVTWANDAPLTRKPGAAVVVARRGGQVHTHDSINHFFGINGMFTVGSIYWNMGVGENPGDVNQDEEAKNTMITMASNMAWLLKKIKGNND